jgi:flagella basal body P-ring formation protein FlgA
MKLLCTLALLLATNAAAETVVATRTIRPQQIVTAQDLRLDPAVVQGAHNSMAEVIGQEAKYIIYPGRAVMQGSVGAPAVVQRNQMVEMVFTRGGLRIVAEGRALARGGVGDRIRVMNTGSRTVLFGTISSTGTILVSQ